MKRIQPALFAIALALALSSCTAYKAVTTDVNLSASHATGVVHDDQIVIKSEQALSIALDTFNVFLKAEYDNRELFAKIPGAHQTAENIRKNGKKWLKSLEHAHDAYKGNRNAENHATLLTAYRTVQAAIEEAKSYTAKAGTKGV